MRAVPGPSLILGTTAAAVILLVVRLAGAAAGPTAALAGALAAALALAAAWDLIASARAWRDANVRLTRRLPTAFAVGIPRPVTVALDADGPAAWRISFFDHVDTTMRVQDLPAAVVLTGGTRSERAYTVVPTQRGEVTFRPADVRVRSRWGFGELRRRVGAPDVRRVYPDFSQVARYAWLAGDRRLQDMGIKSYQQRGSGTDFKQLAEYRVGDPIRHIDPKATLRIGKPIVREFQEERDQYVMLLIDCGRRMRADDRTGALGAAHFDHVLNAVMLLGYVALREGDAVGAMTFGNPPGQERAFAPRKGAHALNGLMGTLYDVQPELAHADYLRAAEALLRRQTRRSLVIVITNFRQEDDTELSQALRLLRTRHLVLVASLREQVVGQLIAQPLTTEHAAIEVASAHLYEQSRRDGLHAMAARHALTIDAEPPHLGIALVNRYRAMKSAGVI